MLIESSPQKQSYIESIFHSVAIMVSVVFYIYILQWIWSLLSQMKQEDFENSQQLVRLNKFVRKRGISKPLQQKILHYLDFSYQQKRELNSNKHVQGLIQNLPSNIQEEINYEINSKYLSHLEILRKEFSAKTIQRLSRIMKEKLYLPNEIIFSENQQDEISLYLVVHG